MYEKGFTLIELLIVIGIIAILAAAVIITITPGERLAEARDATRDRHLNALQSALYIYAIDNEAYPATITETLTEICNTNLASPSCSGLIDLSATGITIPVDPQGSDDPNGTGYQVAVQSDRILLNAPNAETRTIAVGIPGEGGSPAPWACGDNFTDTRDSNTYSTVEIGTQCWMAENLAYLPSVVGPATGSTSTSYYYVYDYNGTNVETAKATSNYQTYGVLYNYPAALTACPTGWSLPTDSEQHTLDDYLATGTCNASRSGTWDCDPAGEAMKTSTWGGNNSSGFTALPAGYRTTDGSFYLLLSSATFWSSTESGSTRAWRRGLSSSSSTVGRYANSKGNGFSVRCLRD